MVSTTALDPETLDLVLLLPLSFCTHGASALVFWLLGSSFSRGEESQTPRLSPALIVPTSPAVRILPRGHLPTHGSSSALPDSPRVAQRNKQR